MPDKDQNPPMQAPQDEDNRKGKVEAPGEKITDQNQWDKNTEDGNSKPDKDRMQ